MVPELLKQTVMITCFMLVMMLLVETINVYSKGNWTLHLKKSKWMQLFLCAAFGAVPGCLGGYLVVSLYAHRLISLGALVTALVASYGDESFLAYSMMPVSAFKLSVILAGIAIIVGLLTDLLIKKDLLVNKKDFHNLPHHHDIDDQNITVEQIIQQLKNVTFERATLIFGLLLFIFAIASGTLNEEHVQNTWNWVNISFLFITIITLVIVACVSDHFLQDHLWGHIIKKHFLKLFIWTVSALFIIHFALHYLHLGDWVQQNRLMTLLLACLIGIIPESGPHMLFITLFASGNLPFSILLANSIVQDGHAALPLLAESKKSFLVAKTIKLVIALLVGFSGIVLQW
jgi:hypothetical protein